MTRPVKDSRVNQEADPIANLSPNIAAPAAATAPTPQQLSAIVSQTLDDGKAEDIVVIDLGGKSSVADYFIIASGRSSRQVAALADQVVRRLKTEHAAPLGVEGMATGDWVLIDAGDIIVHLFRPEVRGYYNLEKMWGGLADAASARDA
jgi:ribosome-associated protein